MSEQEEPSRPVMIYGSANHASAADLHNLALVVETLIRTQEQAREDQHEMNLWLIGHTGRILTQMLVLWLVVTLGAVGSIVQALR